MSQSQNSILGELRPSKAIVKLAVPATIALLAKAVYRKPPKCEHCLST